MMKLIIRADDVGYSEGVNYGIAKTVHDGLVRSVGVMPNRPAVEHGLELLKGTGVCLGLHTNLCLGKPCANPADVPSLLDENGDLKSSRTYRDAFKRGEEIIELEEVVLEIEAQYHRFVELTGRQPGYFEAHAVASRRLFQGLEIVAEKYKLRYNDLNLLSGTLGGHGTFIGKPIINFPLDENNPAYDPAAWLKKCVEGAEAEAAIPHVFITHPGYLDDELLRKSSLTIPRAKEAAMLCDPAIRQWLAARNVELITYDDI